MKRLILSMAAMLTFGIASAQIDPAQPQQTQPDPVQRVEPDSKNKADTKINVPIDPATTKDQNGITDPKPSRKDELKTVDHIKSTPDPDIVKDKEKKPVKETKKRKKTRN